MTRADGGGPSAAPWRPGGPWGEHGPGGHGGPGGPWRRRGRWRGFGCLFAILFLLVVGSLVAVVASILSNLGWVPALIALVVVILIVVGVGRTLRRTGEALDAMVAATEAVEAGDYSSRVGFAIDVPRPVRQLARGFDTMVERLEVDEQQRRTLLADVSHELRTPLTVIAGNLEAMIDGVRPTDRAHLELVLEETRVLERLIDDLRTVTLSEAGTLALYREPTDPDVLIGDVVRSLEPAALAADVTLTADIPDDLPIMDVDPVRLREVLANLLANALRHTPAGGSVTVRAAIESGDLVVRVTDSGSGIDPDVLPHVFERFVKSPGSSGSGLGLAIARSLTVAHGGTLEVEATGRGGTTFRLSVPVG